MRAALCWSFWALLAFANIVLCQNVWGKKMYFHIIHNMAPNTARIVLQAHTMRQTTGAACESARDDLNQHTAQFEFGPRFVSIFAKSMSAGQGAERI